MTGMCMQCVG